MESVSNGYRDIAMKTEEKNSNNKTSSKKSNLQQINAFI